MASRYENIYRIIREVKPRTILEIGAFDGSQAERMIKEARKFHRFIEYCGFDLFRPAPEYEFSKPGVQPLGVVFDRLRNNTDADVQLFAGDTRETLKQLRGVTFDFIFIDGGHSLGTIANDWMESKRMLAPAGVILMDDYYPSDRTKGCLSLIHSLSIDWKIDILEPIDVFPNGLRIAMVELRHAEYRH